MDEQRDDVQRALSGWARIVNHGHEPTEGQVVTTGSLDWQYRRGVWRRLVQGRL